MPTPAAWSVGCHVEWRVGTRDEGGYPPYSLIHPAKDAGGILMNKNSAKSIPRSPVLMIRLVYPEIHFIIIIIIIIIIHHKLQIIK